LSEPQSNKAFFRITALLALALAIAAIAIGLRASPGSGLVPTQPSVFDRVVKSNQLRASYAVYPPYCIKNANTGKLSGICVEVLEEAAQRLKLKVEWVEEVGWGSIFEGLNSDRHDIFGAGIWRNSSRGKVGDFSQPLLFNVVKVYGRANENRFNTIDSLNDPAVRIVTVDGTLEDVIAKTDFPNASHISVSQLNPYTDVLLSITSNKADIMFSEATAVNRFLEKNPGTLKELFPSEPLRVFPLTFAFKLGEPNFSAMLDAALEEIHNDGTMERILQKYEQIPGEFYRVAPPYILPR